MKRDHHSDLNDFYDQWEKALADGIFDDAPKLPAPSGSFNYFGQLDMSEEDVPLNEVDTKYWDQVYKLSRHAGDAPDPIYFEERTPTNKETKASADHLARSHNPIYPDTLGKDQNVVPTPNWASAGKEFFELEDLKKTLEQLEGKVTSDTVFGKNITSLQGKIDGIKKQIDELSDSLNQNRYFNARLTDGK
jgi:hypothetical protein